MSRMTSMERTLAALSHREGDRVPLFLLLSLYGAKELQISVKEYFSDPKKVAAAQLSMKRKYQSDCYYSFFYAAIETEAFGGETFFVEAGPPNAGEPVIKNVTDIDRLTVPKIEESAGLQKVLEATRLIKEKAGDETPIIGVVMSPYSLPVMQMGFEKYIELLYDSRERFDRLMRVNEAFCANWANAQLAAGATAICYFDPLASPNIVERNLYLQTGNMVAKRTIAAIKGPTATHLASGIALPVLDDVAATGTAVIGFSADDDAAAIKQAAKGKICLLGNLNALAMVRQTPESVGNQVKEVIQAVARGGGFILSDNHGEIPYQMPEANLFSIAEAVENYGTYPLNDGGADE